MTDADKDPFVQQLFAQIEADIPAQPFTHQVMRHTAKLRRRAVALRAVFALVAAILSIPLQDFALAFAQVLMVSLVALDNSLAAQLLAPINSVGGVLSLALLGIRLFHKRLFA